MNLSVKSVVGTLCITHDAGQKVFDQIHPELSSGREVTIDFDGVSIYASPFFNAAIGQLLKDLKPDDLNRLLKVANLSDDGMSVVRRVIENAKNYYDDPNYRKHLEAALAQQAG